MLRTGQLSFLDIRDKTRKSVLRVSPPPTTRFISRHPTLHTHPEEAGSREIAPATINSIDKTSSIFENLRDLAADHLVHWTTTTK